MLAKLLYAHQVRHAVVFNVGGYGEHFKDPAVNFATMREDDAATINVFAEAAKTPLDMTTRDEQPDYLDLVPMLADHFTIRGVTFRASDLPSE
jgi:hypothetical protein